MTKLQPTYDVDPVPSSGEAEGGSGGGAEGSAGDSAGSRPSPYKGGLFRVEIQCEKNYPMSAPKVRATPTLTLRSIAAPGRVLKAEEPDVHINTNSLPLRFVSQPYVRFELMVVLPFVSCSCIWVG